MKLTPALLRAPRARNVNPQEREIGVLIGASPSSVLAVHDRGLGRVQSQPDLYRITRSSRIVRRTAKRAGIGKSISPHTLRHAFITAALDAGVPLRDVQEAASHGDPRTTMRYDRARVSLDRHATYIVAACLAGAAR